MYNIARSDVMNDFPNKLNENIKAVDTALLMYLEKAKHKHTGDLYSAMEYAMFPGGKRLRPLVLIGSCVSAGGGLADALPFACALEMIHAYSLIHDDLPAMDNSDMRRGKPSCHINFGEATAILAGDGLLNLAYEVMLGACVKNPDVKTVRAAHALAEAAGVTGMVGGQAADLYYEKKTASEDVLHYIHENKTSKLFSAAGYTGALLGKANDSDAKAFKTAWKSLGLAFQVKDDIENKTGSAAVLGKPVGNDEENMKNTYVSVFGMDRSKDDMDKYAADGIEMLSKVSCKDSFVTQLAYIIYSKK
jgi:geranylgeranyl diphosphate synthase type II